MASKRRRYTYEQYLRTFAPKMYRDWRYRKLERSLRQSIRDMLTGNTKLVAELWKEWDE